MTTRVESPETERAFSIQMSSLRTEPIYKGNSKMGLVQILEALKGFDDSGPVWTLIEIKWHASLADPDVGHYHIKFTRTGSQYAKDNPST